MEIGYKQLNKIINAINSIPSSEINSEKQQVPINDRLEWAKKRFNDYNEAAIKKMLNGAMDIQREYASVDDKKNFIVTQVGQGEKLSFTNENQKKLIAADDAYMEAGKCEIKPYICNDSSRVNTLPLWIQVDLDGIILNMDPQMKRWAEEENNNESK